MRRNALALWLALSLCSCTALVLGCSGGTSSNAAASDTAADDGSDALVDSASDADAPSDAPSDVFDTLDPGDGGPFPVRRLPCLARTALATDLPSDMFGALEGELVSLVPPGTKICPADSDHLHLQVAVGDKRYDVAVTIASIDGTPMAILTKDLAPALPVLGWSSVGFEYKDLGVASADYAPLAKAALLSRLQTELATASRVSIHGRSYTDGTGLHNVHRNNGGHDGVILMRRNGAGGTDHAIALRFSGDVF